MDTRQFEATFRGSVNEDFYADVETEVVTGYETLMARSREWIGVPETGNLFCQLGMSPGRFGFEGRDSYGRGVRIRALDGITPAEILR